MEPRISLVTLGVGDMARSIRFYAEVLELPQVPTPPGVAFACIAEAILFGLDPLSLQMRGPIDPATVAALDALAERHGFFEELLFPP